jgi:L-amino acid N-acyltransferase YncA
MARSDLKFLIDTNIYIPLEPTAEEGIEPNTALAAQFLRQASETGCRVYIHPASNVDIDRDPKPERQALRRALLDKYPVLPDPPSLNLVEEVLGKVQRDDHDWVDNHMLAALQANAVGWVVTEDRGMHRRARKLQLENRVLRLAEAVIMLEGFFGRLPVPPPAVATMKAHALNPKDRIFNSLRADYPGFDAWFAKARRDHRQSWVINTADGYGALCIVKHEEPPEYGLTGNVLKLCTFKVAEQCNGLRLGELMLKAVFDYAVENRFAWLCVTVFPKQEHLLTFLNDFGFLDLAATTTLGEKVLAKAMVPIGADLANLSPLAFHQRFGPRHLKVGVLPVFAVPIRPEYHRLLFPEAEAQLDLTAGQFPAGNGIRKAYLCRASSREVGEGSPLLFYLSGGAQQFTVLGVAEDTLVSPDPEPIARFVGKRTVYTYEAISKMCEAGPVLAILFRQARVLCPRLALDDLLQEKMVSAHPQSITRLAADAGAWLEKKLMQ